VALLSPKKSACLADILSAHFIFALSRGAFSILMSKLLFVSPESLRNHASLLFLDPA
jgi:hypothetical protein